MDILTLLAINFAVCCTGMLLLWLACVAMKDVTVIDAWWALGMVVLAVSTYLQAGGASERKLLLLGLCAAWGLRLGGYLVWRWRTHGVDKRYKAILGHAQKQRGWGFAKASLLLVFATQAPLQFIVSLPVQLGQIDAQPATLGVIAWIGAGMAVTGILFETIGDWQLVRFRGKSENSGRVLNTGLWRYTRHPNYFGDALTWWGIYLIAAETSTGLWAIIGPIFLTWTLMKWSGAPMLEARLRKTRPDYVAYIEQTSGFVPWPPRTPAG
jgi:steroid 5-alpha reductase family enzyme